jgi:large subunit ribosomal protein L6
MENKVEKKYIIKIPGNVILFYCANKKIIKFIGPFRERSLQLKTKLFISEIKNFIAVTQVPFSQISNNQKKKIKSIQGTTAALIKQLLIELSTTAYQKLKFVGVGYKVFNVENHGDKLLMFKLGFSHVLYFKIPNNLNFFCLKSTKLFIYGNFYQEVNQISALIKSYKYPDPYKGKGILYENEKITLKEGKKI